MRCCGHFRKHDVSHFFLVGHFLVFSAQFCLLPADMLYAVCCMLYAVCCMLLADDPILMYTSPEGHQRQLYAAACEQCQLTVNLSNTKVVTFFFSVTSHANSMVKKCLHIL